MAGLCAGLVLAGPVLLGLEALVAARGEPPGPAPAGADGCVACDGSRPPLRTVWLGDSTASGIGAGAADGILGRQVARRLGRPVDVRILASSGATVNDVLARQLPRLPADTQVVFISVGANDATHLTSSGSFGSSYRKLLAGMPQGACVVLLGAPDIGSPPRLAQPLRAVVGWRGRMLDRRIRSVARRSGAVYVDIAAATGPAFRRDRSLFAGDGYHPNDAGYALWAGAVSSAMAPAGVVGDACP